MPSPLTSPKRTELEFSPAKTKELVEKLKAAVNNKATILLIFLFLNSILIFLLLNILYLVF